MFFSSGICFAQAVGGTGPGIDADPLYSGGPVFLDAFFLIGATEIAYTGNSEVTQEQFVPGDVVKVRNTFGLYRVHTLPAGVSGPEWMEAIAGTGLTERFTQTVKTETHSTSVFVEIPAALPAGDYRVSFSCAVAPNGSWLYTKLGDTMYVDLP
jgi:hypothetical protein